jgi:anti-anti-sigma factor
LSELKPVYDAASGREDASVCPFFRAEWDQQASICTLRLSGELDLSCTAALRAVLRDEFDLPGPPIHIDMSEVSFVDSCCAMEIDRACRRAILSNRQVCLLGAKGQVRRVFKLLAPHRFRDDQP